MPLVAILAMSVLDFCHYQKRLHDKCTHLLGIKCLKHGLVSEAVFEKIQCRIHSTVVPTGIGRIPQNLIWFFSFYS